MTTTLRDVLNFIDNQDDSGVLFRIKTQIAARQKVICSAEAQYVREHMKDALTEEEKNWAERLQKVKAIKSLRDRTGGGLSISECKLIIEQHLESLE